MTDRKRIGKAVRELRRSRGLSQEKLAGKAHLATNWVSQVELGNVSPSIDTLRQLADGLGVPLAEIVAPDEVPLRREIEDLLHDVPPSMRVSMLKVLRETVIHLRMAVQVELGRKLPPPKRR